MRNSTLAFIAYAITLVSCLADDPTVEQTLRDLEPTMQRTRALLLIIGLVTTNLLFTYC